MSAESALVMGVDAGTESLRVGLFDLQGALLHSCSAEYCTSFPANGWAEQTPEDWWNCLGECSREVLAKSAVDPRRVVALSVDTTCCSVVALDNAGASLHSCLLWMDSRAANQCTTILSKAQGDPYLQVNSEGEGPLSAEWMIPKALWMKENIPDVWNKAAYICEKQDYLNFHLTGCMTASACNVAARWHFNAQKALLHSNGAESDDWLVEDRGRPVSLLQKIDLLDLLEKWPVNILPMGSSIGDGLTADAARHLGLPVNTFVAQGGPDAYVGMVGLGCTHKGEVALITGSSHLHLCICDNPPLDATNIGNTGTWGVYRASPVSNISFAEGGQSSTGSVLSWMKNIFNKSSGDGTNSAVSYQDLDQEAAAVPIGAEGLLALETFQGARTPVTNPYQRGALVGLSLAHSRGHIWRAFLEGICFGTRACLEALHIAAEKNGVENMKLIAMAGGATRSAMWLQMHADVTQLPVSVGECDNAPLLGSAVLAAACFRHKDDSNEGKQFPYCIEECVKDMVRQQSVMEPNTENKIYYDEVYEQYVMLAPALSDIFSNIANKKSSL